MMTVDLTAGADWTVSKESDRVVIVSGEFRVILTPDQFDLLTQCFGGWGLLKENLRIQCGLK